MTRRTPSAAPTSRRRRLVAVSSLTPLLALSLGACQWTSPVQTDRAYEPADGKSIAFDHVTVSNLLVVADKKGGEGTLVGMGANETGKPATVTLAIEGVEPVSLDLPAYSSKQLSSSDGQRTAVPNVPVAPGGLLPVQVGGPDGGSRTVQVPVVAPYGHYGAFHPGGEVTPPPAPTSSASHGGH